MATSLQQSEKGGHISKLGSYTYDMMKKILKIGLGDLEIIDLQESLEKSQLAQAELIALSIGKYAERAK